MIRLIYILLLSSGLMLAAEKSPGTTHDLWLRLSAKSQNIARKLESIPGPGQPDYEGFKPQLDFLRQTLEGLEQADAVTKRTFRLRKWRDIDDKEIAILMGYAEKLSEEYGIYVARELIGLGARIRFLTIDPEKFMELTVYLPDDRMTEFSELLEKNDLLAKPENDS